MQTAYRPNRAHRHRQRGTGNSTTSPGTTATAAARRIRSAARGPTTWACTTCWATYWNGAAIGTAPTLLRTPSTRQVPTGARTGPSAAAPGAARPGTCGRRAGTGAIQATGTAISASGSPEVPVQPAQPRGAASPPTKGRGPARRPGSAPANRTHRDCPPAGTTAPPRTTPCTHKTH